MARFFNAVIGKICRKDVRHRDFKQALILSEALYIIKIAVVMYITVSRYGGIGIIGGADEPTAMYLLRNFGFFPIFDIAVFIVGVACIIISAVLLHEKKSK